MAASLALVLVSLFPASTVVVELSGSLEAIAVVKRLIAYLIILIVPAMAITG